MLPNNRTVSKIEQIYTFFYYFATEIDFFTHIPHPNSRLHGPERSRSNKGADIVISCQTEGTE